MVPCDHLERHLADPPRLVTKCDPDLGDGLVVPRPEQPASTPDTQPLAIVAIRIEEPRRRRSSQCRNDIGIGDTAPKELTAVSDDGGASSTRALRLNADARRRSPGPVGHGVILANAGGWGWSFFS